MKTVNKGSQILAMVFGLAALVFFFTNFAVMNDGTLVKALGAQLAFGTKLSSGIKLAKSADILFCFWLTVLGLVLNVSTFISKGKTVKYWAPGVTLASGIYMLVITLSNPWKFVDTRPLENVTDVTYSSGVLLATLALLLAAAFGIVHLLVFDRLTVKGDKLTIPKRIVRFFRDYKSEVKKIVWPNFMTVLKNTGIVLAMCLIIGIFVWLIDYGLGQLLNLVLK